MLNISTTASIQELEQFKRSLKLIPDGPTYHSSTKGVIAIVDMHYNHRLAAAKKILLEAIKVLTADITTAASLSDLEEFVDMPFLEDSQKEMVDNLVNYQPPIKSDTDAQVTSRLAMLFQQFN